MKPEQLVYGMVTAQKEKLLTIARRIEPHLTEEDILQPQDFTQLEHNPEFRYEEGCLHGMESVLAAMRHEQD